MIFRHVFVALSLGVLFAQPAWGQNDYRQSYVSDKEHGTFIAYLKTRPQTAGQSTSNGFITDVELGLKWTGLLGQPVESYTLKWTAGDSYRFFHEGRNDYVYVRRDDLRAHPDLQAQYDAIKPTDIVLEFWLEADAEDGSEPPQPNEYNNYGAFNKGALGSREVRRTPHLVMGRAGCRSSDIVPSSPPSYNEFVRWKRSQNSGTDVEAASKNTLNSAVQITFKDLTIKSVELPDRAFRNIYDEYQRRISVPSDAVAAARKAEADAFWGNERPSATGKRVVSVEQAAPCSELPRFVAEEKFEIQHERDRYVSRISQVITPEGRFLIDPTPKRIISYANGSAYAAEKKPDDYEKRTLYWVARKNQVVCATSVGKSGAQIRDRSSDLFIWYEGSIDKSGNWIGPTEKLGYVRTDRRGSNGCRQHHEDELIQLAKQRGVKIVSHDRYLEAWRSVD